MLYASRACLWLTNGGLWGNSSIVTVTTYECGTYDQLESIRALPVGAITAAQGLTVTVSLAIACHIVAAVALGAVVSTDGKGSSSARSPRRLGVACDVVLLS